MPTLDAIADASIGVLAWIRADGSPGACAVTPYVVDDRVVITSTLAFTAKAAAVRRDPRVAVLAGGWLVSGDADVFVDESPQWFDRHVRAAEVRKFPPTRSILAIPGHRCLFPWYVGRIVISFRPDHVEPAPGDDAATVARLADGRVRVEPVAMTPDELPDFAGCDDGPVQLLFHEEHDRMSDLRQLSIRGSVVRGRFAEERRSGSLGPGSTGTIAQLRELRTMARSAKRNRTKLREWATPPRSA